MALPDISTIAFTDTDAARVEAEVIGAYESITGATLYPGDPVRLFLESLAYVIAQQRVVIDYTGRMNLVRLADGPFLDHLGAFTNAVRLSAAPARTTVRFTLVQASASVTPIPEGTRVTPDGKVFFATARPAEIPAGELSTDVEAACATSGALGNGFLPGQINRLADVVDGVARAVNLTLSQGGADQESDAKFRERVQLSPERFSTCGPRDAYRYWALSAHQDVADVAVVSPAPGQVHVHPLLTGGAMPTPEVLAAVSALLRDDSVRPLTDVVSVMPPVPVSYDVHVVWTLGASSVGLAAAVGELVEEAVAEFVAWQRAVLGRDVNPTRLSTVVEQAGAKRVVLASPGFRELAPEELAVAGSVTVVYGGVEGD